MIITDSVPRVKIRRDSAIHEILGESSRNRTLAVPGPQTSGNGVYQALGSMGLAPLTAFEKRPQQSRT